MGFAVMPMNTLDAQTLLFIVSRSPKPYMVPRRAGCINRYFKGNILPPAKQVQVAHRRVRVLAENYSQYLPKNISYSVRVCNIPAGIFHGVYQLAAGCHNADI